MAEWVKVVKQFREAFAPPASPPTPQPTPTRTRKHKPAPASGINLGDLLGTIGMVGVGTVLTARLLRYLLPETAPVLPAPAVPAAIETVPLVGPDGSTVYVPVTELSSR